MLFYSTSALMKHVVDHLTAHDETWQAQSMAMNSAAGGTLIMLLNIELMMIWPDNWNLFHVLADCGLCGASPYIWLDISMVDLANASFLHTVPCIWSIPSFLAMNPFLIPLINKLWGCFYNVCCPSFEWLEDIGTVANSAKLDFLSSSRISRFH